MLWTADEREQVNEHPMLIYAKVVRALSCTSDDRIPGAAFELLCRNELGADAVVVLTRYLARGNRYRVLWADLSDADAEGGVLPFREIPAEGTCLAELISDLSPCVRGVWQIAADDPLESRLDCFRSMMSLPLYYDGMLDGVVVLFRSVTDGFDPKRVPEMVCLVNLIGRTLRGREREESLRDAVATAEHELHNLSQTQQQILRSAWPVSVRHAAAGSEQCGYANGDYYTCLPLPSGEFGTFLADAAGNRAAGAMTGAVLHALAHVQAVPLDSPSAFLAYLNQHLAKSGWSSSMFATAAYGVYSPTTRVLRYCSAGLPTPRLVSACGAVRDLPVCRGLPLGVRSGEDYKVLSQTLGAGDRVAFYTDGITESNARGAGNAPMDVAGLDRLLAGHRRQTPAEIVRAVMQYLGPYAIEGAEDVNADDRTILVIGAD